MMGTDIWNYVPLKIPATASYIDLGIFSSVSTNHAYFDTSLMQKITRNIM